MLLFKFLCDQFDFGSINDFLLVISVLVPDLNAVFIDAVS